MTRPLRKDAADRRAALLRAAADVFAEEGIETPLDRIAERAGVGRATLYRNFASRAEIALAVLMDEIEALGDRFAAPDGADAFLDFLAALSAMLVRNAALGGIVRAGPSPALLDPIRAALMKAALPPLRASKAAGVIAADIGPSDIRILSAMLSSTLSSAAPDERNAIARRTLSLVIDAVRVRP